MGGPQSGAGRGGVRVTATTNVAAIRARWARVPTAWFWTDLPDGVLRVAFVPLTPGGAVPPRPPDGFPGRAWWAQFPGDMAEYEGADLRMAEAIAAAPTDIAALMAQIDALDDAITELLAPRAQQAEAERARAGAQDNPYPVEVWTELTAAEEAEILNAIRGTSVRNATDRAYASWGRRLLAAAGGDRDRARGGP